MSDTSTSTPKPKTRKVGEIVPVEDGKTVLMPDGYTEVTVHGTEFVLDRPGTFVIDGTEVTAK